MYNDICSLDQMCKVEPNTLINCVACRKDIYCSQTSFTNNDLWLCNKFLSDIFPYSHIVSYDEFCDNICEGKITTIITRKCLGKTICGFVDNAYLTYSHTSTLLVTIYSMPPPVMKNHPNIITSKAWVRN